MAAAAPRPRSAADLEALVARAVEDGRLVESRRGHWVDRLSREGAPAERLLEQLSPAPLQIGTSRAPRAPDEPGSAVASVHPKLAAQLGHRVERPHPLGAGPPRAVSPPEPGRVNRVRDRS